MLNSNLQNFFNGRPNFKMYIIIKDKHKIKKGKCIIAYKICMGCQLQIWSNVVYIFILFSFFHFSIKSYKKKLTSAALI